VIASTEAAVFSEQKLTRDQVLVALGLREDVNKTTDNECLIYHAHYP